MVQRACLQLFSGWPPPSPPIEQRMLRCIAALAGRAPPPPWLPLLARRCAFSGGHSDDGYEVQPARASLQLRGAGTVLCYASHPPTSVSVAGQEVAFEYVAPAAALRFELPALGSASSAKDCTLMF